MILTRFENIHLKVEDVHKLLTTGEIFVIDKAGSVAVLKDSGHPQSTTPYVPVAHGAEEVKNIFQRRLDAGTSI